VQRSWIIGGSVTLSEIDGNRARDFSPSSHEVEEGVALDGIDVGQDDGA